MHYPLTDILADFEINRLIRYQITGDKKLFRQTDRWTPEQTDRRTDRSTIGLFFKKEEPTKNRQK